MKLIRLILESERHVGKDPIEFLKLNTIADGQYVSFGYLIDEPVSKDRRHVDSENDASFRAMLKDTDNRSFVKDMKRLRDSQSYQDALNGTKKTAKFDLLNTVHIMKLGRYSFKWLKYDSLHDQYENEEVPTEWQIRAKHGFLNPNTMTKYDFDEKSAIPSWRDKYGGNTVMPTYRGNNPHTPTSHRLTPSSDFFLDDEDQSITFGTVFGNSTEYAYQYFYVKEASGRILPLNRDAYFFLASAFSTKKLKAAKAEIEEEEQEFLDDMSELTKSYTRCSFHWDRVLYITGYENATGEPFIWINDDVIKETYPYLDDNDLQQLIKDNIEAAKADIEKIMR